MTTGMLMRGSAIEVPAVPGEDKPALRGLSAGDLAELLAAFNDVTGKLQATHETLRGEVARLEGELKRANEQLERSRRLAALGEMAAGIAHEIRNPLGSIRLNARILEQDLGDRPEERSMAGKIIAAVRGLDAVVTDVLAFSKEMRVQLEPALACELLSHALDEGVCADVPGAARVRVVRMDAARGPVWVGCDAALLHRALVNVIRNAVEAMSEGAPVNERGAARRSLPVRTDLIVDVRVRAIEADFAGADDRPMVVLSVRDTGPGVNPTVMERMFNPFFTTRATGTGLGLAIVHRIIDAHGGSVSVRNHEEGGAIVELTLPASPVDGAGMEMAGASVAA
jgi:signal transduction histidine kinase